MMLVKLQQAQESFWGRFLRFEKSQSFEKFQKIFTFKQVFRLRLDDIIYVALLAAICIVFAILPSTNSSSSSSSASAAIISTLLVAAYRYLLMFLIAGSSIWLISTNWYRHFIFALICGIFPLLTLLTYMGVIPIAEVDTTTTIYSYLHILVLWVVYIALYLVYPLK